MTVEIDKVIRVVDKNARLITWGDCDKEGETVLESPEKISPILSRKYVDLPHYISHLGCKRQFRLGIRVNTSMGLSEFVNTWSKHKGVNG